MFKWENIQSTLESWRELTPAQLRDLAKSYRQQLEESATGQESSAQAIPYQIQTLEELEALLSIDATITLKMGDDIVYVNSNQDLESVIHMLQRGTAEVEAITLPNTQADPKQVEFWFRLAQATSLMADVIDTVGIEHFKTRQPILGDLFTKITDSTAGFISLLDFIITEMNFVNVNGDELSPRAVARELVGLVLSNNLGDAVLLQMFDESLAKVLGERATGIITEYLGYEYLKNVYGAENIRHADEKEETLGVDFFVKVNGIDTPVQIKGKYSYNNIHVYAQKDRTQLEKDVDVLFPKIAGKVKKNVEILENNFKNGWMFVVIGSNML